MSARSILVPIALLAVVLMAGCGSSNSAARAGGAGGSAAAEPSGPYAKDGFIVEEVEGRLWVFREGSEDYLEFQRVGEPAKHTTRIGDGPGGMTIKGPDKATIIEYLAAKPGFTAEYGDGILWAFADGSEALEEYRASGEPAKNATLIGVGPLGTSVRSSDKDTIVTWLASKPGYVAEYGDGLLWVFADGSEALEEYRTSGEPAKNATMIGVGPLGKSVRSGDLETIKAWLVAAPGYVTAIQDGRVWVFEPGSEDLAEFHRVGEPAKHVTRIGVGPMGMTVKAPTGELIDRYLADVN